MAKHFVCLSFLSLLLVLVGCNKDTGTASHQTNLQPSKAGVITIISSGKNRQETNKDKFRTFDIRGESTIQYAPQGQEITPEVKNVQVVVAARNSPYGSIQARLMQQRLSKEFIVFCSACHDDYANGVVGPSLIGKNEIEVREMIDKYSKDPNANVLMTSLVERMTPEEIDFIATDLARFNKAIQEEKDPMVSLKKSEERK